jgi:hypothetical protein
VRTLADVIDFHSDISPAVERLIAAAYERHPQRAELEQMIADGAWLLGGTRPDGRLELRIGFPKRVGHADNPNGAVRLMVLPPPAMLTGGQG